MSDEVAKTENRLVINFLILRKCIGILGAIFPFLVVVLALILGDSELRQSISAYYYSPSRDVFVGTLCIIGMFLFSYKGYEPQDDRAGDIAGIAAVGVAFFPTTPSVVVRSSQEILGYLHLASAAILFLALAYFCLRLFVKTGDVALNNYRRTCNKIYRVCGYIILASIALIVIVSFTGFAAGLNPVFWLEAIAVVAFGVSWLVKGNTLSLFLDPKK